MTKQLREPLPTKSTGGKGKRGSGPASSEGLKGRILQLFPLAMISVLIPSGRFLSLPILENKICPLTSVPSRKAK